MEQFLNKLSLGSKIGLGGFLVGFISCFLPWYSISISGMELGGFSSGASVNAMKFTGGVLFFLFCMGGILAGVLPAVVENDQMNKPPAAYALPGVAGLALLSVLVALGEPAGSVSSRNVSAGMGFGWYLALIAALVALAGGALRAKELNLLGGGSGGSPTDSAPPPAPPAEPM